jgi:RNA polymerase sigma-70 factor (ECF subfamily)
MTGSDPGPGALVELVAAGDETAFRTLYRLHADDLFRFALWLSDGVDDVAEELVQETWVRAVRALPDFEGRSSLKTWLCAIATRCAHEDRRRHASERRKRENAPRSESAPAPPVPARLDLRSAIRALPQGFRTVLVLHDVEGFRHDEIAELLGISAGTSKSQLSRARRRVREMMGDDYVTT